MTENKTTELKREYIDAIKNTVTAFANCDGGTIYIGINDDGTVCGVEDVDSTMLRAACAIRDAIRPDVTMCRRRRMVSGNRWCCLTQRDGRRTAESDAKERAVLVASLPAKPCRALMLLPSIALSSPQVKAQI